MNPILLRNRFPAVRSLVYVNSAAAGPVPLDVAQAAMAVYESLMQQGDAEWELHVAEQEEARRALATLAGCTPRELAFTRNTSHSTSLVAQMLWDAGCRSVVALEDEFPASTIPFLHKGFDVRFISPVDGRYPPELIEKELSGRDVLVASHVMFRTGAVNDPVMLGGIARRQKAHFVLCATQSLGALQVDFKASGASFLTGTSHKWLCAGYGGGYLAIRDDLIGTLPWPAAGWLSVRDPDAMRNDVLELQDRARVLELGCPPFAPLLALGAASRMWLNQGPEEVEQRVRSLTLLLRRRLNDEGFAVPVWPESELSGITVVPHEDPEAASARLLQMRIATTPRGNGVRVALHAFNDESDVDAVVKGFVDLRDGG